MGLAKRLRDAVDRKEITRDRAEVVLKAVADQQRGYTEATAQQPENQDADRLARDERGQLLLF